MSDEYEPNGTSDYDPSDQDKIDGLESSKAWLNLIEDSEKAFQDYQNKCDSIDKLYANLLSLSSVSRDREFQLFWANIQVIGPSTYSRPPVPVVVPRFRNRKPIPKTASEMLERCSVVSFEQDDVDYTMRLIRDDVTRLSRGAVWVDYEDKQGKKRRDEKVCRRHIDRRDFTHSPARKWSEVDWVAKRAWLSEDEMEKRFKEYSKDAYCDAVYEEPTRDQRDVGHQDPIKKCGVWEVWCKSENKVVWVTKGVEVCLDAGEPYLDIEGFFPCPRPAYGTLQPGSLIPVPDMLFYKDQLEEINDMTNRIGALAQALQAKGFYPGGGEVGDAVEAALKRADDAAIMVPIANWAAFGGTGEQIIWLPVDMIAKTIAQLVELRRQLIDDVYQISGISDIQRGQSDPNETLGAQELKQSNGAVRIRDKRDEMVRVARDITRISGEIMAENFQQKTLEDMSQMELSTDAQIKKQVKEIEAQANQVSQQVQQQIAQAQQDPQLMQQAQQNPEQAQQMVRQIQQQAQEQIQQLQAQAQKVGETVTIDQVMKLLREQRLRPYVLDIETDSTIAPDENAQKQRATEFITAVGGFLKEAIPAVQMVPQIAPLMADSLKYVASQYRAGRELDASIDEFAEQMKNMASQPKPNPEADAAKAQQEADQQKIQMEQQKLQMQQQAQEADLQAKQADLQMKQQAAQLDSQIKVQLAQHEASLKDAEYKERIANVVQQRDQDAQKHQQDLQKGMLDLELKNTDIVAKRSQALISAETAAQSSELKAKEFNLKSDGLKGDNK